MIGPLTYLDAALIAVTVISGLLAMYRGLTREVLSIMSWALAGLAVLYFVVKHKEIAAEAAKQFNAPLAVAQIGIGAVIFLVVLIVVHLITGRISDSILDSRVGMIDRILGFAFGVVRGFILVVIPYMFYEAAVPDPRQQFPWIRDSISLPYIQSTGTTLSATLRRFVPSSLGGPGEQTG